MANNAIYIPTSTYKVDNSWMKHLYWFKNENKKHLSNRKSSISMMDTER